MTDRLTGSFRRDAAALRERLGCGHSFDMVERTMTVAERESALFFVDGLVKDEVMEKVMEYLLDLQPEDLQDLTPDGFSDRFIPYVEHDLTDTLSAAADAVLCGQLAFLLDGMPGSITIDARTYPDRSPEEPEGDKVLRGARDGFVETVVANTALLRRRLRTGSLIMEHHLVCDRSRTDVVLCYLTDKADKRLLQTLRQRLDAIRLHALTMSQETLSQCLLDRQWLNPFPRMRHTERPDAAAAALSEGRIAILVDNSPVCLITPAVLFDFTQEPNDLYFPPVIGSFLKLVRMAVFLLSLLLTPLWLLLVSSPELLPDWLSFMQLEEAGLLSPFIQLLVVELVLDAIRLASMNTPSALASAFSVVGALILGDFGIQVGWFLPEVVLYMGFTAVADFSQPSYELGYALKLWRVLLLVGVRLLGLYGLLGGLVLLLLQLLTTRTVGRHGYLRPLLPFMPRAFLNMFRYRPARRDDT